MYFEVVVHQSKKDMILYTGKLTQCKIVLNDYLTYLIEKGTVVTSLGDSDVEIDQYLVNTGYLFIQPVSVEQELKKLEARSWALQVARNIPLNWSKMDACLTKASGSIA